MYVWGVFLPYQINSYLEPVSIKNTVKCKDHTPSSRAGAHFLETHNHTWRCISKTEPSDVLGPAIYRSSRRLQLITAVRNKSLQ
jgi:hypothetical protein